MEKDLKYDEAALSYEQAWKYGNKRNPNIGNVIIISIMQHAEMWSVYFIRHQHKQMMMMMMMMMMKLWSHM